MTKTDVRQVMIDRFVDFLEAMSEEYIIDDLEFRVKITEDDINVEVLNG